MNGVSESGEALPLRSSRAPVGDAGFWPAMLMAFAATCITVGIIWDISWHATIGRDTFWTPAHMAIYLGGVLGGCVGGWLAIRDTFFGGAEARERSVQVLGARAPLGAWVAIWGAIAMLTSAPFDNWWHNAYGLDVKIVSPPHTLLGLGMLGISIGALLLVLARQNRQTDGKGGGLFVYMGGIFLLLGGVFVMEFTFPNVQHSALFFKVCAMTFPVRLVMMGRAGKVSWPATKAAAVFITLDCVMIWILPLFQAQPKLAPIFNPVTHMVPPPFPLLLIFPALAIDWILGKIGDATSGWRGVVSAVALGAFFLMVFAVVQWNFAKFLISPYADNWFFAGNRFWSYAGRGKSHAGFWVGSGWLDFSSVVASLGWAAASAWIGLTWGNWMRKVQR